jgi:hypothetical protein
LSRTPEPDRHGERRARLARPPGPGDLAVGEHRAGPAEHRPQRLGQGRVRDEQRPVAGLQEQVERAEQGGPGRGRDVVQPGGVLGQQPAPLAVHRHLDGVLRPPGLHVLDRRVEVAGDELRRRRAEQPQVAADDVQPRRHGVRGHQAGHRAQHRWRGARLQLQPGAQRGQPERHLVQMRGVAGPAEPQIRLRHQRGQPRGHLALDHRGRHHLAHGRGDGVQCLEAADARVLERLRRVVDALAGVGVAERRGGRGDPGQVGPPVQMRGAADRPHRGRLVTGLRRGHPAQRERPRSAVRPGVLDAEVEDGGVGNAARDPAELLGVHPQVEHLPAGQGRRHGCTLAPATDGGDAVAAGSTGSGSVRAPCRG